MRKVFKPSAPLTLEDFKEDYMRLVVQYENLNFRKAAAFKLIEGHYKHIESQCAQYLNSRI